MQTTIHVGLTVGTLDGCKLGIIDGLFVGFALGADHKNVAILGSKNTKNATQI